MVEKEEAEEKSRELGVMFCETSAKTGDNIKGLFRTIATNLPGLDDSTTAKGDDEETIDLPSKSNTEVSSTGCICFGGGGSSSSASS